jgi:hypothetical protein
MRNGEISIAKTMVVKFFQRPSYEEKAGAPKNLEKDHDYVE